MQDMELQLRKEAVMTKKTGRCLLLSLILSVAFILYTLLVKCINVEAIGPKGSSVGFAGINQAFINFVGYNNLAYNISEIAGYLSIAVAGVLALYGVYQLVTRKSLKKVDPDLYVLCGVYVITVVLYVLFDKAIVINYRPVILDEGLEPSFPSTHSMLSIVIMLTAAATIRHRVKNRVKRAIINGALYFVMALVLVMRIMSGVHWITDIIGGVLLGLTIVSVYYTGYRYVKNKYMS